MNMYLDVRTNIPDVIVDYLEVRLTSGETVCLNWDESNISRSEHGFSAHYGGVHFGDENGAGKLSELQDLKILDAQLYCGDKKKAHFMIERLEIEDEDKTLLIENPAAPSFYGKKISGNKEFVFSDCDDWELSKGNVKVSWCDLGEGLNGDYDINDPEDIKLLRFDVFVLRDGEWEIIDNTSHCTQFPVSSSYEEKMLGLHLLMDKFYEPLSKDIDNIDVSVNKIGDEMSWISPESFKHNAKPSLLEIIQNAAGRKSDDKLSYKSPEISIQK